MNNASFQMKMYVQETIKKVMNKGSRLRHELWGLRSNLEFSEGDSLYLQDAKVGVVTSVVKGLSITYHFA